jgi:AbrB family looped-hinge helix DNA binding protein
MALAQSRVTAQGQISVPSEVRKKLGISPGSVLEWEERGNEMIVRRAGTYSSADIHDAIFADEKPRRKSVKDLKEGIRRSIRKRHARR